MSALSDHMERMVRAVRTVLYRLQPREASDDATPWTPDQSVQVLAAALREGYDAANRAGASLGDRALAARYGLEPIDVCALWLALVPHIEPEAHAWIARAQGSPRRDRVEVGLCLRALCASRAEKIRMMAALSPVGVMVARDLLRVAPYDSQRRNALFHEVSPNPQLPFYVSGLRVLSPDLAGFASVVDPLLNPEHVPLVAEAQALEAPIRNYFARPRVPLGQALGPRGMDHPAGIALVLEGSPGTGRATAMKAIAAKLGRRVIMVDGEALAEATTREALAALEALFVEAEIFEEIICLRNARRVVEEQGPMSVLIGRELRHRAVVFAIALDRKEQVCPAIAPMVLMRSALDARPSEDAMRRIWVANLDAERLDIERVDLEYLTRRVNLKPLQVRKALALGHLTAPDASVQDDAGRVALDTGLLEQAAMAQISKSIGELATVSEPRLSFEELVVDADIERQVREIISAVHSRRMVLESWGIGQRIRRGTGVIVLFDGEPGTGKTHCTEVIASELNLSLVRINIASIMDKYIGETEKNLTKIFERARPDVSLLLFDEADSLFSKRTQKMERSTDRYSNMNINVLLQLIERYEGITVLTTNLKKAIDPAFERRFTYKIHFKMPERPERLRIWQYLLPESVTTSEEIDFEWLADLELSGGEIKNAIMLGAYRAAYEGDLLNSEYLYDAGQREAAAAGRIIRR